MYIGIKPHFNKPVAAILEQHKEMTIVNKATTLALSEEQISRPFPPYVRHRFTETGNLCAKRALPISGRAKHLISYLAVEVLGIPSPLPLCHDSNKGIIGKMDSTVEAFSATLSAAVASN